MAPTDTDSILTETATDRIAAALAKLAGESIDQIDASLPRALAGDRAQVHVYIHAYHRVVRDMLAAIGEAHPDLRERWQPVGPGHEPEVGASHSIEHESTSWLIAVLDETALSAPFTPWVSSMGPGRGTAVSLVARLRQILPGLTLLSPPEHWHAPPWGLDSREVIRFYRAVIDHLQEEEAPLERLRAVLNLNMTELADLFGVSRQALGRWLVKGVPAEHQEKLTTLGGIADLLTAQLKPDRIPGVVRRPAEAYGGRSILEAISADEQDAVLDELRGAFDWSIAA